MSLAALLAVAAVLATAPLSPRSTPGDTATTTDSATLSAGPPAVRVTVDSAREEIVITAGPFRLEDMSHMAHMSATGSMGEHADHHREHHTTPLMRFQWPVDGWMRGFRVDVRDAAGKPLPSRVLHHLIGVNLDRRQLVYPAVERLFGWGTETAPVELPKSMGVPLGAGDQLGMYAMFDNQTGQDIPAAYLHVTLLYTPKGHHPLSVLPLYVDVNNVIGGATTFDLPPGKSSHAYTFEIPVGVRVIAVGGHLHDYGTELRLEDAESGKVLVNLKAKRDDRGHVEGVGRFIFGFGPDALHLESGHRYRVVAEYLNPTRDTVKTGGMGHINGAIVPDDMRRWPALDPNDPMVKKDVATLPR